MANRRLVSSASFSKAYRKFGKKSPHHVKSLEQTLLDLGADAFNTALKTHKLSGNLYGLYACSCGYDCRIIFSIEKLPDTGEEVILLIDIGTHDEVY